MDDLDAVLRARRDLVAAGASASLVEALAATDALTHEILDPHTMGKIALSVRMLLQMYGLVGPTDENVELVVSNYDKVVQMATLMVEVDGRPLDTRVLAPEIVQGAVGTVARKELDPLRRAVDEALDLAVEAFKPPKVPGDEADYLVNEVFAPFVRESLASGPFAEVSIARIRWLVAELWLPEAYGLLPKIASIGATWTVKDA